MKIITLENGEVRHGYQFIDLCEDSQNKVLDDQVQFEIDIMDENSPYYNIAIKMERMQTPWFLGEEIYHNHKDDLIDNIDANGYLFDEYGDILPVTYHINNKNECIKTTFGKHEILCTLTPKT